MAVISERFDDLGRDGAPARLGIMGGTFDPIHIGHLACAEQAREAFGLDGVLFVPAGNPVFKKDRAVTPAGMRLAMCRLAVASNPAFDVSAVEVERGGDTYTVDTLRQLRAHYPRQRGAVLHHRRRRGVPYPAVARERRHSRPGAPHRGDAAGLRAFGRSGARSSPSAVASPSTTWR